MVRFAPTRLRAIIAVLVAAGFVGCATKELPPFTGPDPIETIDAYSQECLKQGADLEQMTEAVHVSTAIRGGASLVHGLQMLENVSESSM